MRTQNIPFSIYKKKITLNYLKSAVMGFCTKGLKNEFETAVVNEPSVFEPLKFYYTSNSNIKVMDLLPEDNSTVLPQFKLGVNS